MLQAIKNNPFSTIVGGFFLFGANKALHTYEASQRIQTFCSTAISQTARKASCTVAYTGLYHELTFATLYGCLTIGVIVLTCLYRCNQPAKKPDNQVKEPAMGKIVETPTQHRRVRHRVEDV